MRGGYVDVENLPAEAEIEAEGSEMTSQLVILPVIAGGNTVAYCSVSTKGSRGVTRHLNCSLGQLFIPRQSR
jgi:hypothetical protein